ncbi:MAG: extracellular solute-binding protein [Roseiflexaceae bacterium]
MSRSNYRGLFVTLLLAALLSACGGQAAAPPAANNPAGQPPAASAPGDKAVDAQWAYQPMKETTKVVMHMEASPPQRTLQRFAPEIRDKLNIDLQIVTVPFPEKYGLQKLDLSSGAQQYDIYVHWPKYTAEFAPYIAKFKDIAPGGEEQVRRDLQVDDVHPSYQWTLKYKEDVVATQIDGDVKLLHYRYDLANDPEEKAAFKAKYGYDLDMDNLTWDKYLNVAEFFTRPEQNLYGAAEPTGFLVYFFFMDRFNGMGGHLFNYDDMTPLPDKGLAIKALQNGIDTFSKFSAPEAKSFEYSDANTQLWVDGRAFMMPGWPDGWRAASDPESSKLVGKIGVAEMPGFDQNSQVAFRPHAAGGRVAWIGSESKVKEAAYKVLVFFSDKDRTRYLVNDTQGWLDPWRVSHFNPVLYSSLCKDDFALCERYVRVLEKSTKDGYPESQITGTAEYHDIIERWAGKAFSGQATADEAYAGMVKEMNEVTDKLGRDDQLASWRTYVDTVLKPLKLYP